MYNETENLFWNIINCFSNIVCMLPFSAGNGVKNMTQNFKNSMPAKKKRKKLTPKPKLKLK